MGAGGGNTQAALDKQGKNVGIQEEKAQGTCAFRVSTVGFRGREAGWGRGDEAGICSNRKLTTVKFWGHSRSGGFRDKVVLEHGVHTSHWGPCAIADFTYWWFLYFSPLEAEDGLREWPRCILMTKKSKEGCQWALQKISGNGSSTPHLFSSAFPLSAQRKECFSEYLLCLQSFTRPQTQTDRQKKHRNLRVCSLEKTQLSQ